jgi:hypothetical protein
MKTIQSIEKENIGNLKFSKREVLMDPNEIQQRRLDLYRAQSLGNLLQSKVNITFETSDETIYQVSTTVWAVGQDFITLKGGIHIPISSVVEVA